MDVVEATRIADFLNWLPQNTYKFDIMEISKALHNCEFKCKMPIVGDTDQNKAAERDLIRFMEDLDLIPPSHLTNLAELDETEKGISWWRLSAYPDLPVGTGISPDSNAYPYLTTLFVVWIPNQPGKLKAVLSAISEFDLLFTSTINVGEYGLIYLFPRSCLPAEADTPLDGHDYQILKTEKLPNDLRPILQQYIHHENCVVRSVQGLLLKVQDSKSGLLSALRRLETDITEIGDKKVNIEVAYAFPHREGASLCIVLMEENDLSDTINAFERRPHANI